MAWATAKIKDLSMHGFSAKSITYHPTARVRSKRQFILRDLGMSGMELQESVQKIRM